MVSTLAVVGKSGAGKTTVVKAFAQVLKEFFPDKTILLFDNDLSQELSSSFGIKVKNTIHGIRSGKHEYKTGIPAGMSKQEYVEWALEDIIANVDENLDIVASWLISSKDCMCPITQIMRDALKKLMARYDFVIFDCEFDLKYLSHLVDAHFDTTIVVCEPTKTSIQLASHIIDSSKKYALNGQLGVVLNKMDCGIDQEISTLLRGLELDVLGILPRGEEGLIQAIKEFYIRLNLPQTKGAQ